MLLMVVKELVVSSFEYLSLAIRVNAAYELSNALFTLP